MTLHLSELTHTLRVRIIIIICLPREVLHHLEASETKNQQRIQYHHCCFSTLDDVVKTYQSGRLADKHCGTEQLN